MATKAIQSASAAKTMMAQSVAIRREVPWDSVVAALWQ